jgi:hypothetical protein
VRAVPTFPTEKLTIIAWPDEVIDRVGHDARSRYVETFWLGVLGPSTTWLLRHLVDELELRPSGFVMQLGPTASRIGVGMKGGRHSPFTRALGRLVQFEMAQLQGPDLFAVRRRVPSLSRRHIQRLPEQLQIEHADWLARAVARSANYTDV